VAEQSLEEHRKEFRYIRSTSHPVVPINVEELFTEDPDFWSGVKLSIQNDFRTLDPFLLRLHYRRHCEYDLAQRQLICKFLAIGYLLSHDVRYFNEFLWFKEAGVDPLSAFMHDEFRSNLIDGRYHVFPLATADRVAAFVDEHTIPIKQESQKLRLRIALLGAPNNFCQLYDELCARQNEVIAYYFSYAKPRWKRLLKSNPLVYRTAFRLSGVKFPYKAFHLKPRDPEIHTILARDSLDLGIHCLSFITRENLLQAFSHGVLNDHLAVLPFVRGRSSVEFALLFGHPVGSTIHFVDPGIDTGPILEFHTYSLDEFRGSTSHQIKKKIEERRQERFQKTVRRYQAGSVKPLPNPLEQGLQFYTMHDMLRKHVDTKILEIG